MPSESSSSPSTARSSTKPRRPSTIDVAYSSRGTDITISVPYEPKRSGDRRRVMEKARRMLAIALEEERHAGEKVQQVQALPKSRVGRKPGTGAWWMF